MSRMQGLTLKVNQGNIKAIRGVTTINNPSQAIVAVDNFDICPNNGIVPEYASIYLWSFRNCKFLGGQVGVATQMRKQMAGSVKNHRTGLQVQGVFSGNLQPRANTTCNDVDWGGLGESFAVSNCNFENNNIGFVTAHHQAFCHFVSDCQFINDTLGISQYGARGTDHLWGGALTGYTGDNAGGNFTILHSTFNSYSRDFQTTFQTQTVPDYFNSCTFNAPTALLYSGDNYPSLQNNWLPHYRRKKNTIGFVENSIFGYDHTQDALFKNPPINNTPQAFEDYFKNFTFVAHNMSSIFCLNSDLTKTTFTKTGIAPLEAFPANNTAQLQGVGYGMIAQCKMPGQPNSTFSTYGSKPALSSFHFNLNLVTRKDKNGNPIPQSNPPYPQGYGVTPPTGLYTPRYFNKEIVSLDMNSTQPTNDYYFWRIGLMASGGTLARHIDFALPMQRILYNTGEQILSYSEDIELAQKSLNMRIFPNPSSGSFTIEPKVGFDTNYPIVISISDIQGRPVWRDEVKINAGETIPILKTFPPGTYIVHLRNNRYSISQKIVVH
ncbi:MAG: T9SS type A sorting domain-containing protein [Saprospiraceae bacterium]|nr:T9SS type A sorting domain-containing protein [Saprospiraceae bacterium]